MTINTKYAVGDKVWAIIDDRLAQCSICSISILAGANNTYVCEYELYTHRFPNVTKKESLVYSTPEEAIEWLNKHLR